MYTAKTIETELWIASWYLQYYKV